MFIPKERILGIFGQNLRITVNSNRFGDQYPGFIARIAFNCILLECINDKASFEHIIQAGIVMITSNTMKELIISTLSIAFVALSTSACIVAGSDKKSFVLPFNKENAEIIAVALNHDSPIQDSPTLEFYGCSDETKLMEIIADYMYGSTAYPGVKTVKPTKPALIVSYVSDDTPYSIVLQDQLLVLNEYNLESDDPQEYQKTSYYKTSSTILWDEIENVLSTPAAPYPNDMYLGIPQLQLVFDTADSVLVPRQVIDGTCYYIPGFVGFSYEPAPAAKPVQPKPSAPAPSSSDEFSLDDILAEFK